MANHTTDVTFRGAPREVDFEYEGDGVIVWYFTDEMVCGGEDTSDSERGDVYEQLWRYLEDFWAGGPGDE